MKEWIPALTLVAGIALVWVYFLLEVLPKI